MAASYFDTIFGTVDPQLDEIYGKAFFYRRCGVIIEIIATVQAHKIEASDSNGLMGSWHGHHFELRTSDLVIGGVVFKPEVGDEIAELSDDELTYDIFQVVTPPGARCFDPVDVEEHKLMVFTQFLRTEQA